MARAGNRAVVSFLALTAVVAGCRATAPTRVLTAEDLRVARAHLSRALPAEMAALYRLRVRSSGGLHLTVLTATESGRMSVSEPFGSAVSLTAWSPTGSPQLFDLRRGCRVRAADVSAALGVAHLPLPQASRLLGGRLPAAPDDVVTARPDGRLVVSGDDWGCLVTVAPAPWRVIRVEELEGGEGGGWRVELGDHTSSLPGRLRFVGRDGRWAELVLVRLEWTEDGELPALPDLPPCGVELDADAGLGA